MKKIFRLLLLGFLIITVLSPSIVTAAEDQIVQEPSSSVYTDVDNIALFETPSVNEVTLENGESFTMTKAFLCTYELLATGWTIVEPMSDDEEVFSVTKVSFSENSYHEDGPYIYKTNKSIQVDNFELGGPPVGDFFIYNRGIRLTNYSAGAVTYKVTFYSDYKN